MIIGINFIQHSQKKNAIHRKKKTYYFKARSDYSDTMAAGLQNSLIWILAKRPSDKHHPKKYPQLAQIAEVLKNDEWVAVHPDLNLKELSTLSFMWPSPTATKRFDFKDNGDLNFPTIEDGFKDLDHDYNLIFNQAKKDNEAHDQTAQ